MAYKGSNSKIVSSSFLYSTLQNLYSKIKSLVDNKADKTDLNNISPTSISEGYTNKSFYLNTHPENKGVLIPFINNDLAFLLKRGGSISVYYDGVEQSLPDISRVFDGSPSYWSMNPTDIKEIVMELTLHKVFTWTNTIYVDFGSAGWRAKSIKIDVMNTNNNETEWTNQSTITNNEFGEHKVTFLHNDENGFNKVRFTFSDWNSVNLFRIACLGVVHCNSSGLRETYLSREGGTVYGTIAPYTTNSYNLGESSLKWKNIYSTKFNGDLNGNASTATALTTNAGSTTQPVYFKDGKPVATTYTLGKSVPSNAVFTDTNTKVTQTPTTSNALYPLLLTPNNQTATTTTGTYFDSGVTLNPSNNTITANITGSAGWLKNPKNIGKASFDGKEDITLDTIMGRASLTSSAADYNGQYTKFATIDISSGAWIGCCGTFDVFDTEVFSFDGQLSFYARTGSDIASSSINLYWLSLSDYKYANCVVAVKVSDGIYDLYFKSCANYESIKFTLINCFCPNNITLYSNQGYVESVEIARTSYLKNVANSAWTLDGLTSTIDELNYCDGVTSNIQTQLNNKSSTSHSHGLLNTSLICRLENTTEDSGWSMLNSDYKGFLLKSIRTQANAPDWIAKNYGSGIVFGGDDTKGVLSVQYNAPVIKFAGGNSTHPVWWLGLHGSSGKTYNLENFSLTSHTHSYIPLSGSTSITGNMRTTGEYQTSNPNGLRLTGGNHGLVFRNYANYTYFLLTDKDNQYGEWNDLRPITIDNRTGLVSMQNGLQAELTGNASSATTLKGLTATVAELNYCDGVTSNIQTQLNGKAANNHTHDEYYDANQARSANTILAAPNGSAGGATFRTLVAADLPSHYHNYLAGWTDNRNVNTTPNYYNGKFEIVGLKTNSQIGFPDSSTYSSVLGCRAWSDSSGGQSHEIALTGNGQIFQRHGETNSWSSWYRVYTSENITYGTSALTPGSSNLATGNIYLQYE